MKFHSIVDYLFWPILLTFAVIVILAIPFEIFSQIDVWGGFQLSEAGAKQEFCEFHGFERFIRQPSNSWSNMIYFFFGILYFVFAYKDRKLKLKDRHNFVTRYPSYSMVLGSVMIYLAFASFFYHAALIEFSRRLDITGVVASCIIPFSYSVLRLYGLINFRESELFYLRTYKIHIISAIAACILFFISDFHGREVTAALITMIALVGTYTQIKFKPRVKIGYFIAAIASIIVSTALWLLDKELVCDPTSVFQLHALWHILTGISVFLIYTFFRTELLFKHHIKINSNEN